MLFFIARSFRGKVVYWNSDNSDWYQNAELASSYRSRYIAECIAKLYGGYVVQILKVLQDEASATYTG